jgi:hypothetical protein
MLRERALILISFLLLQAHSEARVSFSQPEYRFQFTPGQSFYLELLSLLKEHDPSIPVNWRVSNQRPSWIEVLSNPERIRGITQAGTFRFRIDVNQEETGDSTFIQIEVGTPECSARASYQLMAFFKDTKPDCSLIKSKIKKQIVEPLRGKGYTVFVPMLACNGGGETSLTLWIESPSLDQDEKLKTELQNFTFEKQRLSFIKVSAFRLYRSLSVLGAARYPLVILANTSYPKTPERVCSVLESEKIMKDEWNTVLTGTDTRFLEIADRHFEKEQIQPLEDALKQPHRKEIFYGVSLLTEQGLWSYVLDPFYFW